MNLCVSMLSLLTGSSETAVYWFPYVPVILIDKICCMYRVLLERIYTHKMKVFVMNSKGEKVVFYCSLIACQLQPITYN